MGTWQFTSLTRVLERWLHEGVIADLPLPAPLL